jgi:NADPH-dependent curcumin reductase CurA
VLVSGAAGGVGTAVGQIAKIKGAKVVGIAGGEEKCRMLVEELGFYAAVDYKAGGLYDQLREQTPDRVDVFFDNVGGAVLDAASRASDKAPAWSSAEPSPVTTRRHARPGRATTWRCSSSAPR